MPVVKSLGTQLKESYAARLSCAGTRRTKIQTMGVESGVATSERAPEGETSVLKANPVVKVGPPAVSLDCLVRKRRFIESGLPPRLSAEGQAPVRTAPSVRAAPSTRRSSTGDRRSSSKVHLPILPPDRQLLLSLAEPHSAAPFQSYTCGGSKVLQAATLTSCSTP